MCNTDKTEIDNFLKSSYDFTMTKLIRHYISKEINKLRKPSSYAGIKAVHDEQQAKKRTLEEKERRRQERRNNRRQTQPQEI